MMMPPPVTAKGDGRGVPSRAAVIIREGSERWLVVLVVVFVRDTHVSDKPAKTMPSGRISGLVIRVLNIPFHSIQFNLMLCATMVSLEDDCSCIVGV